MSGDSYLATYVYWVKNFTHMDNKVVKRITVHHQAGSNTPQQLARMFNGDRKASSNYGISNDGVVSQMVRESDRAWTSGGKATKYVQFPGKGGDNDACAVTIEVANSTGAPDWKISDKAWQSLVLLCADICKRHNIKPSYTGDLRGTFTEHQMFAATACPGPYLHKRMAQLVEDVKKAMASGTYVAPQNVCYKVQLGAFSKKGNATKLCNQLKTKGFDAFVLEEGTFWKVQVGSFREYHNAVTKQLQLKEAGYKDSIIKEYKV